MMNCGELFGCLINANKFEETLPVQEYIIHSPTVECRGIKVRERRYGERYELVYPKWA